MIPLSVFPFSSAPCRKRVVSYPIIAFCCRSFNLSVTPAACHCPGCGSQHLLRPLVRASHPAGRGPNSDSLFPPLAAVVVVAPNEGRPWHSVKPYLFARGSPTRGAVEELATRLRGWTKESLTFWQLFCAKRGPDSCPALFEVSAYSALVSGFASSAFASGFAAGAAGAAGFTTGFGGYGSSFRGKRMIFFGHFWAHIPQPLHLS